MSSSSLGCGVSWKGISNNCLRCGVSVSDFDGDDGVVGVVLDDNNDDGGGDLVGLRQEVISGGSWSVLLLLF